MPLRIGRETQVLLLRCSPMKVQQHILGQRPKNPQITETERMYIHGSRDVTQRTVRTQTEAADALLAT